VPRFDALRKLSRSRHNVAAVTRATAPLLALSGALAAWCLAIALREAVSWEDARELVTTLASTLDVAVDRLLHGDLDGALRALAAL
jgi:hypothetical protein